MKKQSAFEKATEYPVEDLNLRGALQEVNTELLEACQSALVYLRDSGHQNVRGEHQRVCLPVTVKKLEAAIGKAQGRP